MARIVLTLLLLLNSIVVLSQTPIYISGGMDTRQGILRANKHGCFAITANHDLNGTDLNVVGSNGERTKAEVIIRYPEQDVAIIRLGDALSGCNEWNISNDGNDYPGQFFDGVLSIRDDLGDFQFIHVNILTSDDQYYTVEPKSKSNRLIPGMSGGALFSTNKDFLGFLISVDPDDHTGIVYQSDNILRLVDSHFLTSSIFSLESAIQIVESAIERKDGSNLGQIEAIEFLIRNNYDLKSVDLRGINLNKADLTGGNFESGQFQFAEMGSLQGKRINLINSKLDFANAEKIDLSNAKMSNASAIMLNAQDANFFESDLTGSLFFGADFRNADFTRANLTGTVFSFCDLRGAKFDESQMINTGLIASILDSASFANSKFEQVNFNGSVADSFEFSKVQKAQLCRYVSDERTETLRSAVVDLYVRIMEKTPSTRFDSGFTYDDLVNIDHNFATSSGALPLCRDGLNASISNQFFHANSHTRGYEKSLLDKSNRRNKLRAIASEFQSRCLRYLTPERKYRSAEYLKETKKRMAKITGQIKPSSSPPIINNDVALLALIKNNVIQEDEINWEYYAKKYLETSSSNNSWPRAITYGVSANDMINEWIPFYKDWSLKRAKAYDNTILIRHRNIYNRFKDSEITLSTNPMKKRHRSDELFTDEELASGQMARVAYLDLYYTGEKVVADELFLEHETNYTSVLARIPSEASSGNMNQLNLGIAYRINEIGIREHVKDKSYFYAKVSLMDVHYRLNDSLSWNKVPEFEPMHSWRGTDISRKDLLSYENRAKGISNANKTLNPLENANGLIIKLGFGVVKSEDINWSASAMRYLKAEQGVDSSYVGNLDPDWMPFFPPSSHTSRVAVPDKWVDLFKDWIMRLAQEPPRFMTIKSNINNLARSSENPERIIIKEPNTVTYWKNQYAELFEKENVDPKQADVLQVPYTPLEKTAIPSSQYYIKISPTEKKELSFKPQELETNYPLRNLEVKTVYETSKINHFWYKEQNVIFIYCTPVKVLYKPVQGDWTGTSFFEQK
ncbi:MAG: pentapeptide repeat-containing protein [Ekhidna sp.]